MGCKAKVKWSGELSQTFSISKGMRQGSILSPRLFSVFINDLLLQLNTDENNLFSTTTTGLQILINTCESYAKSWRIKFNPTKTKCTEIGKATQKTPPAWTLDGETIKLTDETTILGVNFTNDLKAS